MSFLDVLNESSESTAPVYHDFLRRFDPKIKQVFVFYEGDEDSSFYKQFLQKHIPDDFELEEIIAGCKNNVLKIHNEFDWDQYSKSQIIFIVDRDLSYWLSEPAITEENIFVTDEYSVENYVVNKDTFKTWLTSFQGFARATKDEVTEMVNCFSRLLPVFKDSMIPIMAAAIVGKRKDRTITLSDLKIKSVLQFYIDQDCLQFKLEDPKDVKIKWSLTPEDEQEIEKQIAIINDHIDKYSVRGKWLIVFMAEMGEYMRLHAKSFAPSLNREKAKQTCAVATKQSMTVLAPRALKTEPPRLKSFLENTYSHFCEHHLLPA